MLIALVLMALAAILAVKVGFGGFIERKRTMGMLASEQAFQFALGAEGLAADALFTQFSQTKTLVTLADPWAQRPQPIPLRPPNDPEGEPMGTLEGYLQDEQGKFNLNSLAHRVNDAPDPVPYEHFKRLLALLKLEDKWADLARDWIDADSDPAFPNGAEDAVYSAQVPPYRTGNWPMLSTTELLSLPGFGPDRMRKLAPYVTALPISDDKINVCTASAYVLDALTGSDEWTRDPEALANGRKSGCFPQLTGVVAGAGVKQEQVDQVRQTSSQYFLLTTRVTLGSAEFTLYSLLQRDQFNGRSMPILRTFGTR